MTWTRWTKEEIDKLTAMYPNHNTFEIAQVLGRGLESVQNKAARLRLKKTKEYMIEKGRETGRRSALLRGDKVWTEKDLEKLKKIYATTSTRELAKMFNCTIDAIRGQAWLLKLHKDLSKLGRIQQENVHRIGAEGERLAEEFFQKIGWKILKREQNLGNNVGITPFDFIIKTNTGEKWAINVKHGKSMHLRFVSLRNLKKLPYRSALLYVTPNKQFFFMPIICLTWYNDKSGLLRHFNS